MRIGSYLRLSVIGTSTSLGSDGERSRTIGYRLSEEIKNRTPKTEHRALKKGFTLVELLIATTIFAVVSVALYSTFSSGMSIWRRAGKLSLGEAKNLIKIEKINRELRKAIVFKNQSKAFWGNKRRFRFMVIIDSEISFVTYAFEENKKMFLRYIIKAKDAIMAEKNNEEIKFLAVPYIVNVNNFSISYFYFNTKEGIYQWKSHFNEQGLPLAVKFTITIGNEVYTSTVSIPYA